MASGNLINGETLHGTFTLEKQSGTLLTLQTSGKYVDKQIALTLNAQQADVAFSGVHLSGETGASFTNMDVGTENTSGVIIGTGGYAYCDPVIFVSDVDGWVSIPSGTQVHDGDSISMNGTKYYATGVTLKNGKSFNVTVPNGDNDTITFHFAVDDNGNVTIT